MDYNNMRVAELKALMREYGLRGYSWLRKAELIALLQNNPPPTPRTPAPCARPPTALRTRPPRPTRPPPPPPPPPLPSVRFRLDRPRQPELMRRLEGIPTPPVPRSAVPGGLLCRGSSEQRPPPRPAPRPPPK